MCPTTLIAVFDPFLAHKKCTCGNEMVFHEKGSDQQFFPLLNSLPCTTEKENKTLSFLDFIQDAT